MALSKRRKSERPVADKPYTQQLIEERRQYKGDPALPGIAGYHGLDPLSRTAMPHSRFNYKRPDGKDQ